MKKVIIIGATSGIGRGLAEAFINEGCIIGIVGRRKLILQEICSQSEDCHYRVCDITNDDNTLCLLNTLTDEMGGMDILVICSGVGEVNPKLDYQLEKPTLLTNVIGFTNIVDWAFSFFQRQKSGQLVVISSIGGIRGSGVAPAYNASKAFQMNYTEGLRQKAVKLAYPLYITDIRPGFVNTAMAKGEGLFWVTPLDKAVRQIYKAITRKKKVCYISKRWRYIALLLKVIPSYLYCKM
ncbi:SDR family NAD(P)-dependent oxidoreductase [Bacteroides sp.]|uniref:SDR family NAD(P)-dependent oxidoreductase n=1 Tax=Bacteroides sp. TaxID=29523 RepID=UPI0025C192C5|nr:SDR family NAD(P)-dependent oxidoreductase [Bacteroides sp.]